MTRQEFDALVAEDPGFTGELVRLMGVQLQRSRALQAPGASATSVIVVMPAHEGLPLQAVVAGLVEELGAGGGVARLDGPAATPLDPAAEAELLELRARGRSRRARRGGRGPLARLLPAPLRPCRRAGR